MLMVRTLLSLGMLGLLWPIGLSAQNQVEFRGQALPAPHFQALSEVDMAKPPSSAFVSPNLFRDNQQWLVMIQDLHEAIGQKEKQKKEVLYWIREEERRIHALVLRKERIQWQLDRLQNLESEDFLMLSQRLEQEMQHIDMEIGNHHLRQRRYFQLISACSEEIMQYQLWIHRAEKQYRSQSIMMID